MAGVISEKQLTLAARIANMTAAIRVRKPKTREAPLAIASMQRATLTNLASCHPEAQQATWATTVPPMAIRSSSSPVLDALPGNPEYSLGTLPPQYQRC